DFKHRIAHATMTFAIGTGLTAQEINPVASTYGYERLRFPRPVYIGDTSSTTATIKTKADGPKRPALGRAVEACDVRNPRAEAVLYCEHILLVQMKPVD